MSYDMEKGYTRHSITDSGDQNIVVELGTICIINHLKMLLWDKDIRAYSYYIETSVNKLNWDRVVDHTKYHCRSWQYLFFASRAVRYIKLVGTFNTSNKVFHVVALEAYFTSKFPTMVDGLIVPNNNVATGIKLIISNHHTQETYSNHSSSFFFFYRIRCPQWK